MFKDRLNQLIEKKNSLLCVGLDPDIELIPKFLLRDRDPLFTFLKEIIEATSDTAIAYKPNIAFYETLGTPGWKLLEKILEIIPADVLIVADAKRADIGNSSRKYAELFFQNYKFDAITVSPYLGQDSVIPFMDFEDRGIFVLCLTSNKGSQDFQYLNIDSEPLYLRIARKVSEWNLRSGNCGLVVGATHPEDMGSIREVAPELPFLIPGIGAQGGNLKIAVQFGTDAASGCALITASRSILYASPDVDFAMAAEETANKLKDEINQNRKIKLSGNL
jgi:orotidine-5'-phosphate decarboxylase